MTFEELPVPPHFDAEKTALVWKVEYQKIADAARSWAAKHKIQPANKDNFRIGLLLVDCQNTFCTPSHELFVAGRSGTAAVDDSGRICTFIYRNLGIISSITVSMDTHLAVQIFHPAFIVDDKGSNPPPYTMISSDDIETGRWRVSQWALDSTPLGDHPDPQKYLLHYAQALEKTGKYQLMIWPYHAMLGGIGHALVSSIEEAAFFHTIARGAQTHFVSKGGNALTEHYSIFRPEITEDAEGKPIASTNERLVNDLLRFDAIIIAGQAKSHCVAWTVSDLLHTITERDAAMAKKVYLLEDCTSPVVVEGADFTDQADAAFARFAEAGMNIVHSTDPIASWPGIPR
jgi:nicotinamidase-related amidase